MLSRWSRKLTRDRAAEGAAIEPIRDHAIDPGRARGMDQVRRLEAGRILVSKSIARVAASWHAAVCSDCRCLDRRDRAGSRGVWHALNPTHEANAKRLRCT